MFLFEPMDASLNSLSSNLELCLHRRGGFSIKIMNDKTQLLRISVFSLVQLIIQHKNVKARYSVK